MTISDTTTTTLHLAQDVSAICVLGVEFPAALKPAYLLYCYNTTVQRKLVKHSLVSWRWSAEDEGNRGAAFMAT